MSAEGADTDFCMCGHSRGRHNHVHSKAVKFCWAAGCSCSEFDLRSDRAPVVDSAALPTQLAQPTGRRASSIACVYIAGPFSGSDGWEIKCNVHRAEELARQVAQLGAMPMTPHSIGANMAGTESQTFWLAATLEMMRRCDAVLFTDDWRRSAGARGEMAEAARLEMPVFYSVASLKRWLEGGNAPAMVAAIGKRDGGA